MTAKPDYIILGDSHSIALNNGAKLEDLSVETINYSGALWHKGILSFGPRGFECRGAPSAMRKINSIREKYKINTLTDLDVPIVSTMGYHLGLLLGPLSWNGHQIHNAQTTDVNEGTRVISTAFFNDYLSHFRARHFTVAKRLSNRTRFIIVPPPISQETLNSRYVRDMITDKYKSMGITVYDPMDDLAGSDGLLPKKLLLPDNIHATAEYGQLVMSKIGQLI